MKKIQIKLPPTLHHVLKIRVAEDATTIQDKIVELILEYASKPIEKKENQKD